jgi:hypothetical protein
VSPILVRPVREQFEHDRVIRVLQAKYKRKYEVAINPGSEQNAAVGIGELAMYPDLVLFSQERARKIQGTVEVETTESINTLEAMAEWAPFSRLRTPFFLYVPANSIDTVRRLCSEHSIDPAEIWTYHTALDQLRFTMVHRSPDAPKGTINEHKPKVATPPPARAVADPDATVPVPEQAKPAATRVTNAKPAPAKAAPAKPAKGTGPKPIAAKPATAKPAAKPAKPAKAAKRPAASRSAASKKPASRSASAKSAKSRKSASGKSAAKKRR